MNGERRAASRFCAHVRGGELRVRLRPGHLVQLVNVSMRGVLIEGSRRLVPGACVDLQIDRDNDRFSYRARVVRAYVSGLGADTIVYRAALALDTPVAWLEEIQDAGIAAG